LRPWAVAAGLFLVGIMLAACAVTPPVTLPQITGLTPQVLQVSKPASVTVQVQDWLPGSQLALQPAGPYVTHELSLPATPLALASDGVRAFVATAQRELLVVEFPANQSAARIVARQRLPKMPRDLVYADGHALVALAGGDVQWWSMVPGQRPLLQTSLTLPGALRDMAASADGIYFLLDGRGGNSLLQRWHLTAGEARREAQWTLPLAAHAFAVRGQRLWVVDGDGVAELELGTDGARLVARQNTSGVADDVQLQGSLVLVADGRGGLVVFDIADPARLKWRGSFNKRGAISGFAAQGENALLNLAEGGVLRLGLDNPALPSSGAAFYTPTPVTASTLQGDVVLLASGRGLQRVKMVGKGDGAISSVGLNLGGSRRGVIRDDILYVADWFSGLHLYDIRQPRRLRHLGNYHTPGSSKGVALLDHYALVGDDDQGLQIIDIADPRRPRWVAELPPEAMARLGLAYTMDIVGSTLYLADHRGGFHIIDLSDIRRPRRLGGYDTPGKAWDIAVRDQVAYVADDRGGLLMFDVRDPASPTPFAQFNPEGQAEDVLLHDGLAYVAFFDQGLYVLDVADPRQARVLSHIPIPGNARGLALDGGLLYVASWEAGLQVVDVREARAPRIIGAFDTDGAAWGVEVKDNFAYVLDWWGGIKVIDVSNPRRPQYVDRYQARGVLARLRTRGNYLFAASGGAGLQVYDIKNPLNPIWMNGVDVPGNVSDLWLEDDRLYLAAGDGGVAILDILDPFYTHSLGRFQTPGRAMRIVAGNDYLYIVDDQAGLLLVDVRDPQAAKTVAQYSLQPRDLWLEDHTLWLVEDAGFSAWTVADDGRIKRIKAVAGHFRLVRAQGDLLATVSAQGEVQLWRLEAQGLKKLGRYHADAGLSDMQLDGTRLLLLDSRHGLQVLDIRTPQTPRLSTVYPPTGRHTTVASARGAVFFAGETRLASVRLLPVLDISPAGKDRDALTLQIPTTLPRGEYHLLAQHPQGQARLFPQALRLQLAPPGGKNITLEAFRRLLKAPLKPPPEVNTELPSTGP